MIRSVRLMQGNSSGKSLLLCAWIAGGIGLGFVSDSTLGGDDDRSERQKISSDRREAKLRRILQQQAEEFLTVYLQGANGTYINGTSLSHQDLRSVVRQSGLKKVVLTARQDVTQPRIEKIKSLLIEYGVTSIVPPEPRLTPKELVRYQLRAAEQQRRKKLTAILDRQQDDVIRLYVKGRRVWVNGRSVSDTELQDVVRRSELSAAELSAESTVSAERIDQVRTILRRTGIKAVRMVLPAK